MKHQELVERFKQEHPDKTLLFLMIAGSHFFDLNSPNSDLDFRGIYISNSGVESKKGEVVYKTNNSKNTKNDSDDVDFNLYSLEKYLTLLKQGDFNMMEMLFAPREKVLYSSEIYEQLVHIRESLLTNDISCFLGFIKKEYKRYGVDKNHLVIQQNFLNFLNSIKKHHHDTLADYWPEIEQYASNPDNYIKISSTMNVNKELPSIVIAKRMFQNTVKISYVTEALELMISQYGHRRQSMAKDGVEFKGLYHAMRLLLEAETLISSGRLDFPFSEENMALLRSIKNSQIEPEFLFSLIDSKIENLSQIEKTIKSNQKNIDAIIDKLIFTYYGQQKFKKILKDALK